MGIRLRLGTLTRTRWSTQKRDYQMITNKLNHNNRSLTFTQFNRHRFRNLQSAHRPSPHQSLISWLRVLLPWLLLIAHQRGTYSHLKSSAIHVVKLEIPLSSMSTRQFNGCLPSLFSWLEAGSAAFAQFHSV